MKLVGRIFVGKHLTEEKTYIKVLTFEGGGLFHPKTFCPRKVEYSTFFPSARQKVMTN